MNDDFYLGDDVIGKGVASEGGTPSVLVCIFLYFSFNSLTLTNPAPAPYKD